MFCIRALNENLGYDKDKVVKLLIKLGLDVNEEYDCREFISYTVRHRNTVKENLFHRYFKENMKKTLYPYQFENSRVHLGELPDISLIVLMIQNGAKNLNYKDGSTSHNPFSEAYHKGRFDLLETMIDHFEFAEIQNQCESLMPAFIKSCVLPEAIVIKIIDKFIELNYVFDTKNSWLNLAIKFNKNEIAESLIAKGFPLDVKDQNGKTPLAMVINCRNDVIIKILVNKSENKQMLEKINVLKTKERNEETTKEFYDICKELINDGTSGNTDILTLIESIPKISGDDIPPVKEFYLTDTDFKEMIFKSFDEKKYDLADFLIDRNRGVGHQYNGKSTLANLVLIKLCYPEKVPLSFLDYAEDVLEFLLKKSPNLSCELSIPTFGGKSRMTISIIKTILKYLSDEYKTNLIKTISNLESIKISKQQFVIEIIEEVGGHNKFNSLLLHQMISLKFTKDDSEIFEWDNCNIIAQYLLGHDFPLTAVDDKGRTPLHLAAMYGDKTLVEMIIDKLNDDQISVKDHEGRTPFHCMNSKTAEPLIEKMRPENFLIQDRGLNTPLHLAIMKGNKEVALKLIEKMDSRDLALQDGNGDMSLHRAINKNNNEAAKKLIEKMDSKDLALQNYDGNTALHQAINEGNKEIANELIAKMNQGDLDLEYKHGPNDFRNALYLAIMKGNIEIANKLIQKMSPDALNGSRNAKPEHGPLCLALKEGYVDLVLNFIKHADDIGFFSHAHRESNKDYLNQLMSEICTKYNNTEDEALKSNLAKTRQIAKNVELISKIYKDKCTEEKKNELINDIISLPDYAMRDLNSNDKQLLDKLGELSKDYAEIFTQANLKEVEKENNLFDSQGADTVSSAEKGSNVSGQGNPADSGGGDNQRQLISGGGASNKDDASTSKTLTNTPPQDASITSYRWLSSTSLGYCVAGAIVIVGGGVLINHFVPMKNWAKNIADLCQSTFRNLN